MHPLARDRAEHRLGEPGATHRLADQAREALYAYASIAPAPASSRR